MSIRGTDDHRQPARLPTSLCFDDDLDASVANTGQVAGRIQDLPPAADIIKAMWRGCREVLAATSERVGEP